MYEAFIGYDEAGNELWVDHSWLKQGCTDETYFNWMYSLWTAQNPGIRQMITDGMPYRKFIASIDDRAVEGDWNSHYRRFILEKVD